MISTEIKVRWQGMHRDGRTGKLRDRLKLWSPEAIKNMNEFMKIPVTISKRVKERVMIRGIMADGKRYEDLGQKAQVWIPPWYPQPRHPGRWREHVSGWARYKNRKDYNEARNLPQFRNFFMSGGMWKSLQAKAVAPGEVRVMFAGSSPRFRVTKEFYADRRDDRVRFQNEPQRMQNRKKASGSARRYGDILTLSLEETREHFKLMTEYTKAHVLFPSWAKTRQGFAIRTLDAQIKARQRSLDRKLKRMMAKAEREAKSQPNRKGTTENI